METILDRFCLDLPSRPLKNHKILVTGATGYIGGELIPELIARGYDVKIMVRSMRPEYKERWPSVEICVADVLNYEQLAHALVGIQSAYYLIHSFYDRDCFEENDLKAARNFRKAADTNHLERIIYLGGLGEKEKDLSDHLRSRLMVGEVLSDGKTPVTFLRAAVVIGSGSSSYQIIKHLVSNCPLFIFPSWAKSKCQPIAIRDTITYLVG
ncbi:MAG: NAD(P)H-binding protein [Aureibaculum sp.]